MTKAQWVVFIKEGYFFDKGVHFHWQMQRFRKGLLTKKEVSVQVSQKGVSF